eukprot:TRINITY_DN34008_c0_g1_i1.p1 TRINITY_DN34008_c0_g1~~TRINITY_DN34008_c0_g1_i1.p1  ORF type:complete len:150 (+),score=27.67 TRINITY_DN34008_c0_g1_i1:45-452(+)
MQFLCDGSVAIEARNEYLLQCIVKAKLKDGRTSDLHQVREKVETGNHEWMYQLERNKMGHAYKALNQAVARIYAGDIVAAQQHYTDHGRHCDNTNLLLRYLRNTGLAPQPVDLFAPAARVPSLGTPDWISEEDGA